jgi:hypothetical protein
VAAEKDSTMGTHAVLYHRKPHDDALRSFAKNLMQSKPFKLLLAREGQRGIGAAGRRGDSPGSADGSHLSAASASEELITAIRLEARHAHSRRHLKALQDLSRARINTPQIALVTF